MLDYPYEYSTSGRFKYIDHEDVLACPMQQPARTAGTTMRWCEMGYRRCRNCGWLSTRKYVLSKGGETVCPECEIPTHGFTFDPPRKRVNDEMPAAHERDEWPEVEL